jgi:hypothetical protein
MSDLAKVHPGDPLRIPAHDYNAMVDAARAHRRSAHPVAALLRERRPADTTTPGVVWVRNASGGDVDRFGVLGVAGVVIDPTTDAASEASFTGNPGGPLLDGDTPDAATHTTFVIAQEPIASGRIGRAVISGMTIAKLDDGSTAATTAGMGDSVDELVAGAPGAAIVWQDGTGSDAWALVRLGDSRDLIPVVMSQTGGSAGDKDAQCSFTYTVRDLASNDLATGVDPLAAPHVWRRMPRGQYLAATAGLALVQADGSPAIHWINEVPNANACDESGGGS